MAGPLVQSCGSVIYFFINHISSSALDLLFLPLSLWCHVLEIVYYFSAAFTHYFRGWAQNDDFRVHVCIGSGGAGPLAPVP